MAKGVEEMTGREKELEGREQSEGLRDIEMTLALEGNREEGEEGEDVIVCEGGFTRGESNEIELRERPHKEGDIILVVPQTSIVGQERKENEKKGWKRRARERKEGERSSEDYEGVREDGEREKVGAKRGFERREDGDIRAKQPKHQRVMGEQENENYGTVVAATQPRRSL